MKMKLIFGLAIFLLLPLSVFAQIPDALSFPMKVVNTTGTVVNTSISLNISIFNSFTGGTVLYQDVQTISTDEFGIATPKVYGTGLPYSENYYVAFRIEAGDETSPRINITPSPYSQNSRNASFAGNSGNASFSGGGNYDDLSNTPTINSSSTTDELQDLWETLDSDSGSTSADSQTDTLTVAGGNDIDTSVSGDTLTITLESILNFVTNILGLNRIEFGTSGLRNETVDFSNLTGTFCLDSGCQNVIWNSTNDLSDTNELYNDAPLTANDSNLFAYSSGNASRISQIVSEGNLTGKAAGGALSGTYPNPLIVNISTNASGVLCQDIFGAASDLCTITASGYNDGPLTVNDTLLFRNVSQLRGNVTQNTLRISSNATKLNNLLVNVSQTTIRLGGNATRINNLYTVGNLTGKTAGGDLTGTYPNPSLAQNQDFTNVTHTNLTVGSWIFYDNGTHLVIR